MAFIDKLGDKITSGVNSVQHSAKKMSDSAKINNEISSNKREIDKRMNRIGVRVKTQLMDSITDEEVLKLSAEIDELIAKNEQLDTQLRAIKGERRCTNCGEILTPESVFCPECGTKNDVVSPVQQAATVSPRVVSVRPVAVQPTDNNLNSEPVIIAENTSEPENVATDTPDGILCGKCGYRETPDAVFCSNCGSKLDK